MIITKPHEKKFAGLMLVLFIVSAALVVTIASVEWHPNQQSGIAGTGNVHKSTAAAAMPWPSSTPHPQPWPDPDSWSYTRSFGQRYYDVRSASPTNTRGSEFIMSLAQSGWPLPVLETKVMWWDWNDQSLQGYEASPPTKVLYGNLVLNAILIGICVWLIVTMPSFFIVFSKRRFWARRGRCVFCGYDIKDLEKCPECGSQAVKIKPDVLAGANAER